MANNWLTPAEAVKRPGPKRAPKDVKIESTFISITAAVLGTKAVVSWFHCI